MLLAAPDAFKGTATAREVAGAVAVGAARAGWRAESCPLSDGGEGFAAVLEALGGEVREAAVHDPLGRPVQARWRLAGDVAVVESAAAVGLALVGGAEGNDPLRASTAGAGELVAAAVAAGARRVLVGVGGSATTDGGAGAMTALERAGGFGGAEVVVACDVDTPFLDAAAVFGPQKGAGAHDVAILTGRLRRLAAAYATRYGVDVTALPGAGAAGGLAGGLAALGARLEPGFDLVAEAVGLERRLDGVDLVVTGEGCLDATSWRGKVVGGVVSRAAAAGVPVLVVAGSVAAGVELPEPAPAVVSLEDRVGPERARADPKGSVAAAVAAALAGWP